MNITRHAAGAFAAAAIVAAPAVAHAQQAPATENSEDVAAIRAELETLRHDYEARIDSLEARLARAEAAQHGTPTAAPGAATPADQAVASAAPPADQTTEAPAPNQSAVLAEAPPPPTAAATASQNIYNPGIAVALNGSLTEARRDTQGAPISGFATGDEIDRPQRGFSLGESEISFAANVDPFLAAFMDFSVNGANEISLEEAYIRSTSLPYGLTLRAGRFLSGIGYLNERHAHDWQFADAPLPYRAFLNTQLGDDGVQLRWLAPTDQYLEFGAEAFRGEAFPAAGGANNGIGTYTAFARTGADISAESSWLAALSYLHSRAIDRDSNGDLFSGASDLGVATLVYKWAPQGNFALRNFVLAGEYFYGRDDGTFGGIPVNQTHTGWYVQGDYQFMPQWSLGLRLSGLNSDDPGLLLAGTSLDDQGHSPLDITGLLEFDTTEFSRLRLQYTHDESSPATNDIVTMQYTVIYGPHGAHRY